MWLVLSGGILLYLGSIVLPIIYCHYNGKETVAVVTNTSTKMESGLGTEPAHQVQYYTLTFDGHNVQDHTSGKRKVGDQLPVIYLATNPGGVVRGSRADGLWRTIQSSTNETNLTIAAAVAVFFMFCATKAPEGRKA